MHWSITSINRFKELGTIFGIGTAVVVAFAGIIAWSDGHNDERYATKTDGAILMEKVSKIEKQNDQILDMLEELLKQVH